MGGILYVPQTGIITPGRMDVKASLEMIVWVAVGGRATLGGPILGAVGVSLAYSYLTGAFPGPGSTSWASSSSPWCSSSPTASPAPPSASRPPSGPRASRRRPKAVAASAEAPAGTAGPGARKAAHPPLEETKA